MEASSEAGVLQGIRRTISAIELVLGALMLLIVLVGVSLQILQRYLNLTDVGWSGEVAKMALVVLSLLLAGYLASRDEHITLEFIDPLLPKRMLGVVWLFSRVVVVVIAAAFAYAGFVLVSSGVTGSLASVAVPKWPFFALAAVGFLLVVVDVVLSLVISRGRMPRLDEAQKFSGV